MLTRDLFEQTFGLKRSPEEIERTFLGIYFHGIRREDGEPDGAEQGHTE
jgi:hypothetical protein